MTFLVEFNQKANLPAQPGDSVLFRPDRTVNDLLLRFEQDGNDSFELTAAYKWTQSAGGAFASGCFTVPGYATPSALVPHQHRGRGLRRRDQCGRALRGGCRQPQLLRHGRRLPGRVRRDERPLLRR